MRQILAQVPAGSGRQAMQRLVERGASGPACVSGEGVDGAAHDLVLASLPNAAVGPALADLEDLGDLAATVPAAGVFTFEPPRGRPPQELVDVTPRSPVEVVLAGRQSVGGWTAFLGYASTAGVVVWVGLFTESLFLLTAAMLLAPFAGPAMNTAIAVTSGDPGLLRRSVLRYGAGIAVTAVVAFVLSLLVDQTLITALAAGSVTLSNVAFLLPLSAGAAGALYLVQSEHSSLVSGAAVGVLVAAALAPPVGAIGMAVAIGRFDVVARGALILILQLAAITAASSLVLLAYGVTATDHRYATGRTWLPRVGVVVAGVVVAGLLVLQYGAGADLKRSSVARQVAERAGVLTESDDRVTLLEVGADVPSTETTGPPRVIVRVDAELRPDVAVAPGTVEQDLAADLRRRLGRRFDDVAPLVEVTVFAPS